MHPTTADDPPAGAATSTPEPVPIAVVVGSWLPRSETFVHEPLRLQRRTRASVIAGSRTAWADQFPYEPLTHLSLGEQIGYRHLGVCPAIDAILHTSGARLVFAHFGLNGAFIRPFAERARLPLAVLFHGHDVGGLEPRNRWTIRYHRYQRQAPRMFDYASSLLCASSELARKLVEYGAPPDKVRVHRLGVDIERFSPPSPSERESRPTVLMVGRLVEKKGVSYGLRAFARVRERVRSARLRIVGDGPLRRLLATEASSLGLSDCVEFLGPQPSEAVREQMRLAHVLFTPSVTTATGDRESGVIVIKEAASCALPAVASDHGGIPEIVDHERTGLLVPERSVEGLAHALERLLRDDTLRHRMGAEARRKMVDEYDNRVQVAALEQTLLDLL